MDETTETAAFFSMLRIRRIEESIAFHYPEKEMRTPVHLCVGQEATPVGVSQSLQPKDKVLSGHRSHGHYLAKGGNLSRMIAELYGKSGGCSHGLGGSQHLIDLESGFLGSAPILSSTIAIGVGVAWALRHQGTDAVCVVYFGDAATEEGVFHEAMNFASLHSLPIIFVCENNGYSTHSSLSVRQPDRPISNLGIAHNVPAEDVDGNDVMKVRNASEIAVNRARSGGGPTLLVCETYRWLEHVGPNTDTNIGYRTEAEVDKWKLRDPLTIQRNRLIALNQDWGSIEAAGEELIRTEIRQAFEFAQTSSFPDPSQLMAAVYAQSSGTG